FRYGAAIAAALAVTSSCSRSSSGPTPSAAASSTADAIALPGGPPGIGFDDMRFAPALGKVLAPGGRSGRLYIVDAARRVVDAVDGFSASATFEGGHDFGVTSADAGGGFVFATDRTTRRLHVVSLERHAIVASTPLEAEPDYVRFVAPKSEVWVTEPDA